MSSDQAGLHPRKFHLSFRDRQVGLSAIWSILSRFGSMLVTLVSIPLAVNALGSEQFGIWVTITGLFSLLSFLDGGFGNALVNIVAECKANGDSDRLRKSVSTAFFSTGSIAIVGWCIAVLSAFWVDWNWLISVPATFDKSELVLVVIIAATQYFILLPFGLGSKVFAGLQKTHVTSMCTLLTHVCTLAFTIVAWVSDGGLTGFILAFAVGQLIGNIAQGILLIVLDAPLYLPKFGYFSLDTMQELLKVGALFWGLQICAALSFQLDALIVAHFAGLDEAAQLGIVSRLFLIVTSLTAIFTTPLWPAFRDAYVRGEIDWIRKAFARYLKLSVLISLVFSTILFLCFDFVVHLWTTNKVIPSTSLVFALYIWTNILAIGTTMAALLNGLHVVSIQLKLGTLMACLNVLISIQLVHRFGAAGVVWGSILSYTLTIVLPYSIFIPKLLSATTLPRLECSVRNS